MFKPYTHQKIILELGPKKHLLAWGCGTGKTYTAIKLCGNKSTLVICPKSIKEQWFNEVEKHAEWSMGQVFTKEEFKKNHLRCGRFGCIIVDESHFFHGMTGFRKKSGMLKALLAYIKLHNPEKIYLLTATPYMSTPWNIYAAAQILGYNWDYKKYKEYFFSMVNFGGRFPVPVIKKNIEKDIANLVRRLGSTISLQDCFDVPEQTYQVEYFKLTAEQKKAIEGLEEEGIARWTRIHQICGGTLKSDGYSANAEYECEKMDRVLQLAEEHDKLIIICRYNHEIEVIGNKIKQKLSKIYHKINGSVRNRHEIIKEAEKSKEAIVIIQASCSEGFELPSFPVMVHYSYDFSLKNAIQMQGRILRANHLKKNVYISLVVKGSIDEDVYKCIQAKKDFDLEIYNKK